MKSVQSSHLVFLNPPYSNKFLQNYGRKLLLAHIKTC